MSTSIAPLVAAARRGDRDAFARLVRSHAGAVHEVALQITDDATRAEDVAQEAFLAAWRGLRRLRDPDRFSGWVIGIARNRALDAVRRARRRPEIPAGEALPPIAEAGPEPDREALWAAVERLERGQRDVLQLYYRQGHSVSEVARELGLAEPAVRKRLSRGRERLREEVVTGLRAERALVGVFVGWTLPRFAGAASMLGVAAVATLLVIGIATHRTVGRVTASLPPVPQGRVVAPEPRPERPRGSGFVRPAVLAAEDARFYEHGGVDPWAVGRAIWNNVYGDGGLQGGSTISQQLAKRLLVSEGGRPPSLERKLAEVLLAWRLEAELDKDAILDRYLGAVYFGGGAWGIDDAAQTWFGVPVGELTLGQSAFLAALPAAPTALDPRRDPEPVRQRRAWVLDRMVEEGWVSRKAAEAAKTEPLPR
ncbi:MAG: sigma-70 family RNA polymerase sigma factor [Myxococcota bacterium]